MDAQSAASGAVSVMRGRLQLADLEQDILIHLAAILGADDPLSLLRLGAASRLAAIRACCSGESTVGAAAGVVTDAGSATSDLTGADGSEASGAALGSCLTSGAAPAASNGADAALDEGPAAAAADWCVASCRARSAAIVCSSSRPAWPHPCAPSGTRGRKAVYSSYPRRPEPSARRAGGSVRARAAIAACTAA